MNSDTVSELERRRREHGERERVIVGLRERMLRLERAGEELARAAHEVHDGAAQESWARLDHALDGWEQAA